MKNKIYLTLSIIFITIIIIFFLIFLLFFYQNLEFKKKNEESSNFTIIVLPDTQKYSKDYPEIFTNQTKWIVENKDRLNIKFVIHEGDIIDNSAEIRQWDNANSSISILEKNNIPFSLIPGNHDSNNKKNYTYYDLYFPKSRFESKNWFLGNYDNYKNNYALLKINNQNYLFLNLDFCPNESVINWANEILKNYSEYRIILTTHAYLDNNELPKRNSHVCGSTEYLWNNLIKKQKNLQIVLSGHVHAERRRVDLNEYNKSVYQILANYQNMEKGGSGYLRIMTFTKDNKVYVKTYSPYLNNYKQNFESEFVIDLDN
ncbi:MAG: metallophosphoesterase [Candidatus Pacearchaeota archaeon]